MSNLNFMEKLLEGADVEWKPLDKVVEFRRGSFPQPYGNSKWYDGEDCMPFVQVADVSDNGFCLNKKTKQKISKLAQPKSIFVETGTVIVTLQGTIGRVAITQYDCYVDRTLAIFTNYKDDINKKYFAYQLKSKFDLEKKYARGSTLKTITKEEFSKFIIPIPPLHIQNEIVRILDNFTELTAELTAELHARKKQYSYYRDKLLTFEDGEVEWECVSKIFNLKNGYTPSKSKKEYWTNGTVPWFRMEDIRHNGRILNKSIQMVAKDGIKSGKLFPANSIIISTSATIGEHALITVPYLSNQRFTNLSLKKEYSQVFDMKFIYYYCFLLDEWCKKNTTVSSFAGVDMNGFKKFQIPIPPIEKQERIVSILDKFDTLTNSISEGLPKEIKLRQQQYEHYRDLLLTFPKQDAEV